MPATIPAPPVRASCMGNERLRSQGNIPRSLASTDSVRWSSSVMSYACPFGAASLFGSSDLLLLGAQLLDRAR